MKRPRRQGKSLARQDRPHPEATHVESKDTPVVYGVLPVLELLRAESLRIDRLIVAEGARETRISEILELARQNDIVVDRVAREKLGRYVPADANHQGVIALTAAAAYAAADDILNALGDDALLLLLDG